MDYSQQCPSSSSSSSFHFGHHHHRRPSSPPRLSSADCCVASSSSSSCSMPLSSSSSSLPLPLFSPRRRPLVPSSLLLVTTISLLLLLLIQDGLCLVSFFSPDDLKYTFGVDHLSRVPPHRLVSPRLIARPRPVRPEEPMLDLYLELDDDHKQKKPLILPLHSVTDQLVADHLTVIRRTRPDGGGHFQRGREVREQVDDCHYQHRSEHILAAISNCDGLELKGTIIRNGSVHVLHPIPARHIARVRRSTGDGTTTLHVLYRRETAVKGGGDDFCGIENTISSEEMVENEAGIHEDAFVVGQRLIREGELMVELAVFVDEQLWRHFSTMYGALAWQKLQQYTLTMLSNVQLMYRQPTSVPPLTFRVVRYEVYQTQPSAISAYLHENGNAQRYLDLFCRYQRNLGAREWDHALMLTGFDIHRGYGANSISGIARLDGMCDPWNSCTLAEGLDFTSAFIGTHELGHAVGMRHDEPYCAGTYIMSASLGPGKVTWSTCSTRDYQSFIQRLDARQNNCMRTSLLREQLVLTESLKPGQIYDAHEQCRLMHGPSYVQVTPRHDHYDGICHMMWCGQNNYGRIITSHPALEGTLCGTNQWCSLGRCVPWSVGGGFGTVLAPRPPLQQQQVGAAVTSSAATSQSTTTATTTTPRVDGQWSDWSPFECQQCFCSDIIGAIGVAFSQRHCSNPAPQNGGAECNGPAHRASVCARKCSNERQTVNQYITAKCTEHQRVRQDPDLIGTGSQLSRFPLRACKVFCDVRNVSGGPTRNYRFYGDDLPDGAPCGWNRYCLDGECTELACENSALLLSGEYSDEDCPGRDQRCPLNVAESIGRPNETQPLAKGHWDQWSLWSSCTASCGNSGVQFRSRAFIGDKRFESGPTSESQPCNRIPCTPVASTDDAKWTEWSPWTQCSVSCGRGTQSRYRRCITSPTSRRSIVASPTCTPITGKSVELRICEQLSCEQQQQRHNYGKWSEWSAWSTCSSSCGPGSSVRMRTCSQEPCEGLSQQKLACNLRDCATWSQWGAWTDCSLLCGKGVRSRSRTCPTDGLSCAGVGIEQQTCNEQPCDQPSAADNHPRSWSDWSEWGPCSVSCGNGVRRRTRACQSRGSNCAGSHFESSMCNEGDCAVSDASWGGWGYWSPCSESCGIGMRRRVRKCYGSGQCPGSDVQREQCTTVEGERHKCPK